MDDPDAAAYTRDAYQTEIDTQVVDTGRDARGRWVACADTVLYPEGGGQPADHGALDGRPIVDVQRVDHVVRHYLAAADASPEVGSTVRLTLDWRRRFDHMQQHSAQHALTAVAADRFGWSTTAFHLGDHTADIELDTAAIGGAALESLAEALAAELRAGRAIRASFVSTDDAAHHGARSRGLPEGHIGPVRLVTIDGLDVSTCGGTHVSNTAEIEGIALLGTERMRGGVRLHWVAGGRVRRRLAADEARLSGLRRGLGAPDDGLEAALTARLERLAQAEHRVADLESEIARLAARSLLNALAGEAPDVRTGRVLCLGHDVRWTRAQLLLVAKCVREGAPTALVILSAGAAPNGHLVVAADGDVSDARLARVAGAVAAWLGGRGGGRNGLHQGAVAAPERLAGAVGRQDCSFVVASAWSDSSGNSA
ncbi:MAG: alanyl-tRNA editing protein [Ardenticatenales bacterium]